MPMKIRLAEAFFGCVLLCAARPLPAATFQFGLDGSDAPGAPRSYATVARHLVEDGYEVRAPISQVGPNYFVVVLQGVRQYCLMLDAYNETILQRFAYTPNGLKAEIEDSPGPGYPGYPPYADGRYATRVAFRSFRS
jgi:hypothetical protein